MSYRKFQVYFFVAILVLSGLVTLLVFKPYFTLLAFGGVLAIIANPLHRFLLRHMKSESTAAIATVFAAAFVVLVPVGYFLVTLSTELIGMVGGIRKVLAADSVANVFYKFLPVSFHDQIPVIMEESVSLTRGLVESLSGNLFGFFSNIFGVFFGFIIILISMYYLLKDGRRIKKEILILSPLGDEHDELVFRRVFTAVEAVMGGVIIMSVLKGSVAGITYWILGVPAPFFWGMMTGFASFIPLIGSALVTAPVIGYLLITGNMGSAIAMLVVAIGIIGMIDNFLQPKIVQSKTNIHPLLILLSILGGLQFYGFSGFVLGPLTLAVTMALLDIYKKEFKNYVERAAQ